MSKNMSLIRAPRMLRACVVMVVLSQSLYGCGERDDAAQVSCGEGTALNAAKTQCVALTQAPIACGQGTQLNAAGDQCVPSSTTPPIAQVSCGQGTMLSEDKKTCVAIEPMIPVDLDLDGVSAQDGDCDDRNNTIYPGARERGGDLIDSDCDGDPKPALGENLWSAETLAALDLDGDGELEFEEFEASCAKSAMFKGQARPGVAHIQAACSGTNGCRGMVYHAWGELFDHDCKAANYCSGWSCVETAQDQGRTGEQAFMDVGCGDCHGGAGEFKVYVQPGADAQAVVDAFFDRPDDYLRAVIAFGISGATPAKHPFNNMPAYYDRLSRAEMDSLVAHLKTLTLKPEAIEYPERPR